MQRANIAIILISAVYFIACKQKSSIPVPVRDSVRSELDYIRPIPGKNDSLLPADVQRGKVLIAYSDCYTCHTEESRAKGPAFEDVAQRYPVNDGYIELLARKIILGGSGAWGYPVMSAHPELSLEDAKYMVKYILSLK